MMRTDQNGTPKYRSFKAALDPDGWNWFENRNGNWSLTGFSLLLNGHIDTVVFTAIGKRGKALRGGFAISLDAFVDVAVRLLAYLWDVPEEALRNVAALAQYGEARTAYATLGNGENARSLDVAAAFALLEDMTIMEKSDD